MRKILLAALCAFAISGCQQMDQVLVGLGSVMTGTPTQKQQQTSKIDPEISGVRCSVSSVTDGDTFRCLVASSGQDLTVRMAQIDAPELGQPFGRKAKERLEYYISGQTILLMYEGEDKYGRTLAEIRNIQGENINLLMVRDGLAWAYKEYMTDPAYLQAQQAAIDGNLGLWSERGYIYPSDWRKGIRGEVSTADIQNSTRTPSHAISQRSSSRISKNSGGGQGFSCGSKRFCKQMNSCNEAMFYLRQCGVQRLDRDNDGIPCESLCR